MAAFIAATFYTAMVTAGLLVDLIFKAVGIAPTVRDAKVVQASVHWNCTTVLNIIFLALAAVLSYRFIRNDGIAMLRTMNEADGRAPAPTRRGTRLRTGPASRGARQPVQ
jgi:uncharacterized protein